MKELDESRRARIERVIDAHWPELSQIRGVIAARPGFAVADGRLIREPAIVVYVRQKLAPHALAPPDLLPREIDGIRVDVVHADPRAALDLLEEDASRAGRRRADAATRVAPGAGAELEAAADARADAAAAAAAATPYEGLPGDPIDEPFTIDAPILCHVGPDAGWIVLRDFLGGARQALSAAMYDFNADYIERTLIDVAESQSLGITLTLDNGLAADERAIHERLRARLAAAYDAEIVICRRNARFPSAYHEKVAVRDSASFWLSSGNWSRRSQPEIDPIGDPASADGMFTKGNREWHIVIDDERLASLFGRYITHDLEKARLDAAAAIAAGADRALIAALPDLFVALEALADEAAFGIAAAPMPVAPQRLPLAPRPIVVQPLLSPDNYAPRVTDLIRSAQQRLYLQYSYINWTDAAADEAFRDVLTFLGELSWRDDFDLRVIVSSTDAAEKVRRLAEHGWNDQVVRAQSRVHNKGIIADGTRVLVSSQNWSGDGFLRNRDAGVIVEDADIAGYYEAVFLADWTARSRTPFAATPTAIAARDGEPTPPGMVRMTWREYYGD